MDKNIANKITIQEVYEQEKAIVSAKREHYSRALKTFDPRIIKDHDLLKAPRQWDRSYRSDRRDIRMTRASDNLLIIAHVHGSVWGSRADHTAEVSFIYARKRVLDRYNDFCNMRNYSYHAKASERDRVMTIFATKWDVPQGSLVTAKLIRDAHKRILLTS